MTTVTTDFSGTRSTSMIWTMAALLAAVVGVAGSIWLSAGLHLKACSLCLYQRAFLFSAAAVLLVGLATRLRRSTELPLLALPVVAAGWGVAAFHVYLEANGKLECPGGILGIGSAPQQSLALFTIVLLLTSIAAVQRNGSGAMGALAALVLAAVMSVATIKTAPPPQPVPLKPYDQPLEICRPPYRPA